MPASTANYLKATGWRAGGHGWKRFINQRQLPVAGSGARRSRRVLCHRRCDKCGRKRLPSDNAPAAPSRWPPRPGIPQLQNFGIFWGWDQAPTTRSLPPISPRDSQARQNDSWQPPKILSSDDMRGCRAIEAMVMTPAIGRPAREITRAGVKRHSRFGRADGYPTPSCSASAGSEPSAPAWPAKPAADEHAAACPRQPFLPAFADSPPGATDQDQCIPSEIAATMIAVTP